MSGWLTAVARYEGNHDSETMTYQPRAVKSAKPVAAYNGRYLQLNSNEEDGPADHVRVYNLSGFLINSGKREEVLKQLPKGIYIVNGRKTVVK